MPNVVRLVAQYLHLAEVCENVYHFSSGAAPTSTTMNSLIDAFVAWENSHMLGSRSTATSLQRVVCTDLSVPSGLVVDRAIIPAPVGVATGTPAPGNVTFAVAWRTPRGGRSYRGRTFHIGMTTGMASGNTITGSIVTGTLAAYTSLITLGVAPIFHLQVVSRQQGNLWINPAVATAVTACTLDLNLDSQRRRLPSK